MGIVTVNFPRGARKKSKCKTVEIFHSPSPRGRGAVVSTDWCIIVVGPTKYLLSYHIYWLSVFLVSFSQHCFTSGFFRRTTPQESDPGSESTTSNTDWRNGKFASLLKSAVNIFYVYLVFLVGWLSFFICFVASEINGHSIALKIHFLSSVTVVYLNSSLDPVIHCWKMRYIRHAWTYIEDITRWREDMNFMFAWQKQYLTSERTSSQRVMFSRFII